MDFEWDEKKRATNLRTHGLDLMDATLLFDGRPVYSYPSPRLGQERSSLSAYGPANSSPSYGPNARRPFGSSHSGGREMRKNENISRFSADKIRRKVARGESKTDWKRVKAMSQKDVERLADRDEGPLPDNWENQVMAGLPPAKQDIHIRLDGDILEWFKAHGRGYQTRINAVLRAFVQTRERVDRKRVVRSAR
jgi:uncharacterized protein (DUF4415 family)